MRLKVLSWNIWCDCDFAKVCDFLRSSDAHIIGLQEIVPGDTSRDVVSFLDSLGYHHAVAPIGATLDDGRMITSGVFTRFPVKKTRTPVLSKESRRQAIEATVHVGKEPLTVYSLHLTHTHQAESQLQNEQADTVLRALPKERVIVMGDFNATSAMTPVRRMRQVLLDTDPTDAPTLNAGLFDCLVCDATRIPSTRLDYIFVSKDVGFDSWNVETTAQGSDHFPISVMVNV